MNRLKTLIKGDIKNIFRDSVLIMTLVGPLLLCTVFKFGVPPLREVVLNHFNFDLSQYYDLITGFVLLLMAMLVGFMTGLILIEEKDEGLLLYYTITPLGKNGYLFYRLMVPLTINIIYAFIFIPSLGLIEISYIQLFFLVILASLEAILYLLLLTTIAKNRVEAMALGKALGIILMVPVIDRIADFNFEFLYYLVPPFYIGKALEFLHTQDFNFYILVGFVVHLLYIVILYHYFMNKNEV